MKSDRERQISYDATYMWTLKHDTNELVYKTETDTENKHAVTKGENGWERDELKIWD